MGASVENSLRDIARELQLIRKELHTIASSKESNSNNIQIDGEEVFKAVQSTIHGIYQAEEEK